MLLGVTCKYENYAVLLACITKWFVLVGWFYKKLYKFNIWRYNSLCMLQIARYEMKLANEDVSMLSFTAEQIPAPFLLPEMVILE